VRVSGAQQLSEMRTSNAEMTGICWIFNFYYFRFPNQHRWLPKHGRPPEVQCA
jgi:hypothetical protein